MSYIAPLKKFLLGRNPIEIFLFYYFLFVLSHFFVYQHFKYLILSLIGVFSIFINAVLSKYFRKFSWKTLILIRDCYFFSICLLVLYIIQDSSLDRKNEYSNIFLNVLEIIAAFIIFIEIITQTFFKLLLIFSSYLIIEIENKLFVDIKFSIYLFIFFMLYGFKIFLEKFIKDSTNNIKKPKIKVKIKVKNENTNSCDLDLAFLNSNDKIFIINPSQGFSYVGKALRKFINENKMNPINYLDFLKSFQFRLIKEYQSYSVPDEIEEELYNENNKNVFGLNFNEILENVFNKKTKDFIIIFECNSHNTKQFLFVQKSDGNALFRFKNKSNFLNEKNNIIDNYSKIISYVSHEFRTPLNCIINMLQLLQNACDDDCNKFIFPCLISSKFLLNLINDLLDVAQIEAGKFKLILVDFSLRAVLDDIIQLFSFQANKREIDLRFIIEEGIEMIRSDSNRLRQIIMNLLSNSFKYTFTGGTIILKAEKSNLNSILISVSDTGLGIKEVDLGKLFQEFSKITDHQNKALNSQGIGLGLLISNKLVHQLNDYASGITVESEFRKGSKFSFEIKDYLQNEREFMLSLSSHRINSILNIECKMIGYIDQIKEDKTKKSNNILKTQTNFISSKSSKYVENTHSSLIIKSYCSSVSIGSNIFSKHIFFESNSFKNISNEDYFSKELVMKKKKEFILAEMNRKCSCPFVLVVDDSDFNNLAILFHFERLKIPIVTTLSAIEALDKIKNQSENNCCKHFKLILLDLEMPMVDGFEAFEMFKQFYEEKGYPMKVVALTGHSEGSQKHSKAKSIMEDVLVKPISFDDLVCFIEKMFKKIYTISLEIDEYEKDEKNSIGVS